MKLILAGGLEIELAQFTSNSFIAHPATFQEAVDNYTVFVNGLSDVQVKDGDVVVYAATDLTSDGVQIMERAGGGYTAIYYYHGAKAATAEDEFSQVGKILMGVEA